MAHKFSKETRQWFRDFVNGVELRTAPVNGKAGTQSTTYTEGAQGGYIVPNEFHDALTSLTRLDEPGALDVWRAALDNRVPQLQHEAWSKYQTVQAELARKQFVPQIARINAPGKEVSQLARKIGLEVTIWSTSAKPILQQPQSHVSVWLHILAG